MTTQPEQLKQTFYWSDVDNKLITQLSEFSDIFLEPCHISKMITKYVVLNESQKMLMALRPYQFYATEAIIERVKTTTKYGYIWHTTGSGKTLTSFKAAQILTNLQEVHKVVFVVDRRDLDYQTTKEFNSFSKGSIDSTTNTNTLVKQMAGDNKLIVTTIQKLNTAISKKKYLFKMGIVKEKRIIFIFDECHRSQFGKTHEEIKKFFNKCQMFGFTGTPIFEENAGTNEYGRRTTSMLFDKILHKYVITDAIRDDNVLKFSIEYISDVAKRVKHKQIDILLVVNMFLTGFDSKTLNTLYVDKNLRYHGLIQAYSRTNRILNELKSQGNIVCFRNLKEATDKAISLFSNINAKDEIIIQPYEEYVAKFNQAFIALLQIAPTINSVDDLPSEDEELEFIKAFRELMRLKNVLATFTEFDFKDLSMDEQSFEDYKSKYLDLYDKAKSQHQKEKISILSDIDFELELIHRDEINVVYILRLLAKLKDSTLEEQEKQKKAIIELISGDVQMRSKRELIEKFIHENLPEIDDSDNISDEFEAFWSKERVLALEKLSKDEDLDAEKLQAVIGNYMFTEKKPLRDEIIEILHKRPSLKERKTIAERVTEKIIGFVETFINGITEN